MATRDDFVVDFDESPRIIEIEAPSTEVTMQDLVDTVRKIEDAFTQGMPHEKLLNASGKEDLGGSVLVGITADLQNAQLAFEPRRTPAATGVVSTGSGTPVGSPLGPTFNFVDEYADFVSAGIQRGSLAINFTDMSIADVIEVVSATELRTRVLVNGTDNEWDIGDSYQIFNITQCNATGGNLVAVDDVGSRITSVFPSAFVQVVRTASSSATLQEQQDIQYSSFGGGVTVDVTSTNTGTLFPTGTPRAPVNNFTDALSIAAERGFSTLFIIGDATVNSGLDFSGFTIIGESKNKSLFTIDSDANVTDSEFTNATIQGTLDGGNVLFQCSLLTLNFVDGFVEQCVLNETITLSGAADANFLDCFSGVPGVSTPTINMGGSGSSLSIRNYNGGITLTNKTGAYDAVSIDLNSGQIILDNTISAGTVLLRGVGIWTNKSTYSGGANVVDRLVTVDDVQQINFDNEVFIDTVGGSAGTTYPIGTHGSPSNNLVDALSIASSRNINVLRILGTLTIDQDVSNFLIQGESQSKTSLTIDGSYANTTGTEFRNATLNGDLDGSNNIFQCALETISGFDGIIRTSLLKGTLTLSGAADAFLLDSRSGLADTSPIIDFNGSGSELVIRNYNGDITFQNKTGPENVSCDFNSVEITISDSVTNGTIDLRGVGFWANSSTYAGYATVVDNLLATSSILDNLDSRTYDGVSFSDTLKRLLSMATGRIVESASGVYDFYEQDNSTILFTLTKAGSERTRS